MARGKTAEIQTTLIELLKSLEEDKKQEIIRLYEKNKKDTPQTINETTLLKIFLKQLCQQEFKYYVMLFVKLIEGQNFDFALHSEILCELCQQHSKNNLKYDNDVIINIPPGHSKTTICNILYSSWLLGKDPTIRMLVRTTSDAMAIETNTKTAALMTSRAYEEVFGKIVERYTTDDIITFKDTIKGYRNTGAMGTRVTGRNSDFLLIDDPNSTMATKDGLETQQVINQFESGLSTRARGTDNSLQTFIIQQRTAINDLSGHLLEKAKETGRPVNHIIIRAWEEESKDFIIQCKDKDITFFRPRGYLWYPKSKKMLDNRMNLYERMKTNPFLWASQYQQDPSDTGLSLLPFDNFLRYDSEIEDLPLITTFITCDIAFAGDIKNSDRTCICSWGLTSNGDLYLLDIIFDRLPIERIPNIFIDFYKKNELYKINTHRQDASGKFIFENVFCYAFFIEKEKNEMILPYFKGKIGCVKELERKANTTKLIRLNKAIPIFALKIVYLPRKRFFKEINTIKEELRALTPETFDNIGTHDDFTDNLCDAINEGRNTNALVMMNKIKSLMN